MSSGPLDFLRSIELVMKLRLSPLFFLGMLGVLLTSCSVQTPALRVVVERYPGLGSGIYEDLATWEAALGQPHTVYQSDGGQTFFYWPERGVAVFTHPQYEGQYRRRPLLRREVTSVIIPLRQSFHPYFLPVPKGTTIRFDHLLDLDSASWRSVPSRDDGRPSGPWHQDIVRASLLRKTIERVHFEGREPVAIEVRDAWWFSHYD